MKTRCGWSGTDPLYIKYHDEEWGVPLHEDQRLFELLILEGAQAGLSWLTVLRKRENYRRAFDKFNARKIAAYDARKIKSLMEDPGIIRNRLKIESAITNAKCFLNVRKQLGSFSDYLWSFVDGKPILNRWAELKQIPARTEVSDALSKDMKKRGFRFVGSTICYAHMQSCGMVNDHLISCFRYKQVQKH